jgi:hypothetical protein
MSPHEVPRRVLAFMAEHITSLDHLQLLIALIQSGDRWWDATSAARELGTTVGSARRALDHLAAHNLLDIRITADVRYQFRPGTQDLYDAAMDFADQYRTRPLPLLELVSGTSRRNVRDFADAFRIRRDDDS